MPAYTTISNALVSVGARPFATTIQALRDNPLAIAEGDPTAPKIELAALRAPVGGTAFVLKRVRQSNPFSTQYTGGGSGVIPPNYPSPWTRSFDSFDVVRGGVIRVNGSLWRDPASAAMTLAGLRVCRNGVTALEWTTQQTTPLVVGGDIAVGVGDFLTFQIGAGTVSQPFGPIISWGNDFIVYSGTACLAVT